MIYEGAQLDGKEFDKVQPAQLESILVNCYTSGTTGMPKGVLLTHMNFLSTYYASAIHDYDIHEEDISFSYLPLAHVFELYCNMRALFKGASVGYFSGNISKLFEDFSILKPTWSPIVPRLLGRLHD